MLAILSGCDATIAQQAPGAAQSGKESPLREPVLQESDEDAVPTDLFSRVAFKYDHGVFNGGSENDRFRVTGQQSFSATNRFSVGYEVPVFIDFRGGPNAQSGRGLGDIKLESNAVIWRGERFSQAARAEFTFPSASNYSVGFGQNILKIAWSFSTPIGSRNVFSGILAYNKALSARSGLQGLNTFEPEWVLAHEFRKGFAGFLDWDTYQDFNFDRFGQTLKGGLTIQLDRKGRWMVSPYAQFPLNHFTSTTNIKSDSGFDLIWRY